MADSANAGASKKTYPVRCSSLRIGGLVMLAGHPCRIVEISKSMTDKVDIVGIDIFTGIKYEDACCSFINMEVPFVKRTIFQVSGGACTEKN